MECVSEIYELSLRVMIRGCILFGPIIESILRVLFSVRVYVQICGNIVRVKIRVKFI